MHSSPAPSIFHSIAFGRSPLRWVGRALVFTAAAYGLSATAQVSVGAAAAASAPGASNSANGGTGGVGLGGVGPGVTINPGVNSGAGVNVQGRYGGNNALSGPRARANAQRDLPAVADPAEGPQNSGQRALALDGAYRERQAAPARDSTPASR
ncbi:hypothetical protein GT347_09830 [Xylophilus rhododendri]|uniref:Uncharacterized protein n=1 Tax=Xylophilus rhododendri TaxID=2697032 RepID=A0A857J3L9_9BURK|nr:hypothetical protein [Xylophilus rhododendri]QHI98267.1 hypothetical protein GT347_09830 [Xylophilus rhododendri]